MHTDSYYTIGKSHTTCQDYADHSDNIIVVSDGCSRVYDINNKQIKARTDIGARLLAITTLSKLNQQKTQTLDDEFKQIIILADQHRKNLELPKSTLSATLLTATHKNHHFHIIICGDGILCARSRKTQEWTYIKYEYNPLPPMYPTHWLNEAEINKCKITYYELPGPNFGGSTPSWKYWHLTYIPTEDYDTILIFSDGIYSFTQNNKPIQIEEIIDKLLDFKRMKGCFITRNLTAILKQLEKEGIIHQDDLSAAGIHIPEA